ncbi:hypothetical protein F0562_031676 [Nyssa sinensis]|uniref:Uncharacterized protein n=1 Tax=Nyssa sinensis TaxID=561372 RepID=A0A5J5AYT1_9ASTE|nr:hypothetical protein F0562_031676 [Nyssa sinensis]
MATVVDKSHVDLENGGGHHDSAALSGVRRSNRSSTTSDAYNHSWHSPEDSTPCGSSHDERKSSNVSGTEIVGVSEKGRDSSLSECSAEVDLEGGVSEIKRPGSRLRATKPVRSVDQLHAMLPGANEAELIEQWNEANDAAVAAAVAPVPLAETRNFWQGHRFLNFLLACMVFAFVISWLFHFNVPS